jgi:hypothetical protein
MVGLKAAGMDPDSVAMWAAWRAVQTEIHSIWCFPHRMSTVPCMDLCM